MESLRAWFVPTDCVLLPIVVAAPMVAALVCSIHGRRLGAEAVRLLSLAMLGISLSGSVLLLLLVWTQPGSGAARLLWHGWQWFSLSRVGEAGALFSGQEAPLLQVNVSLSVDALSGLVSVLVTLLAVLVQIFATSWLKGRIQSRFLAHSCLFTGAMLLLVLSSNLPVLFVGWQLLALAGALLMGLSLKGKSAARGAWRAFLLHRIADVGLLGAMALLVKHTGALDWDGISAGSRGLLVDVTLWNGRAASALGVEWLSRPRAVSAATLVGGCLLLSCAIKSGLAPFQVWITRSTFSPAPALALIHSGTVSAGVYLLCRLAGVFVLSPTVMMALVAWGLLSALASAAVALPQRNVQIALAYSTSSQLGLAFVAAGVGAFDVAVIHTMSHAVIKACLFLCIGAIHCSLRPGIPSLRLRSQLELMGGLRRFMPRIHVAFLLASLALAGLPLSGGFFAVQGVLGAAFSQSPVALEPAALAWPSWLGAGVYVAGIVGGLLTAIYSLRLYMLAFRGNFRAWELTSVEAEASGSGRHSSPGTSKGPPREGNAAQWAPACALGVCAVAGGVLHSPLFSWTPVSQLLQPLLHATVDPRRIAVAEHDPNLGWLLLAPGVLAFAVGLFVADTVYANPNGISASRVIERWPRLHRWLLNWELLDRWYEAWLVLPLRALASKCVGLLSLLDGTLSRFLAASAAVLGHLLRAFQTGQVQVYSAFLLLGLLGVGGFFVVPHPEAAVLRDPRSGQYAVRATGGPGYAYRWDTNADGVFDSDEFSGVAEVRFFLQPGERREIRLQVQNAWGSLGERTYAVSRPRFDASVPMRSVEDQELP